MRSYPIPPKTLLASVAGCLLLFTTNAAAEADSYQGETVKVIVGFGAGGGTDMYSRLIARNLGKYLPGEPSVIVQNMPGAGSLKAANYVYNVAPADGTVVGIFSEGLILRELLGWSGVKYEFAKFKWLGSAVNTTYACAARSALEVTAKDVLGGRKLVMAASALGSSPYDVPTVLNALLGLNLKIVRGYRSTPNFVQAIAKGEADALCTTLSTLLEPAGQALIGGQKPMGRLFLLLTDDVSADQLDHPQVKGLPSADEMVNSDEARQVLRLFSAPAKVHKAFAAPPRVSEARVALLRKALAAAFNDPSFRTDVQRMSLAAAPISGKKTEEIIRAVFRAPPTIVARLKEILR